MNKQIKAKWIRALRSGRYTQTTNTLRRINKATHKAEGYCCLGVLSDLYAKETGTPWIPCKEFGRTDESLLKGTRSRALLSQPVCRWAGFNERRDDPAVINGAGRRVRLSAMNDDGVSFTEIADAIERSF
jgi:hypothetical protein